MSDQVVERCKELLASGFWCAESVLIAVSEANGVQSELIPKIATGFCSGMARTGGQCGALSGAIMSISMMNGRSSPGASVNATYTRVKKLREMFAQKFGATDCVALLGLDLGSEEDLKRYHDNNYREKCVGYSEACARMAVQLLEEEDERQGG